MNKDKICTILFVSAAICYFIAAILNFMDNAKMQGITMFCFGSAMLCFGSVFKNNKNDD